MVPGVTQVMRDSGAEVAVFALRRRSGQALPFMEKSGLDVYFREGNKNVAKDIVPGLFWLIKQLKAWQPTHLWTSLTKATLLGQIAGQYLNIPVISWQHNAFLKPWNKHLLRLRKKRSRLWIADSNHIGTMTNKSLGVPSEQIKVWPIFAANPEAPVAQCWEPGSAIRIGSLGRLHPNKGYDILLQALNIMKSQGFTPPAPLEITIAGDGDCRQELTRIIEHSEIDYVHLPGFLSPATDFLATLHLYIQPSRNEGFCIAAHEAMQAGLPVIASSVGEMQFTISPGNTGYTVPPEDPHALAKALIRSLQEPEKLYAMGQTARDQLLKTYSHDRFRELGQSILRLI